MNLTWKSLLSMVLAVLQGRVPDWLLVLARSVLSYFDTTVPSPPEESPQGLKDWVHGLLTSVIAKVPYPTVRKWLTMMLDQLNDTAIQELWNTIFPHKAIMSAGPVDLSAELERFNQKFDAAVEQEHEYAKRPE